MVERSGYSAAVGIDALVGVVLWTEQLEEMVRFYETVLELPLRSRHDDFAAFTLQRGVRLSIGLHDQVRGRSHDPHRVMVNLGVGDIHRATATLRERGVVFTREPEQEHWGGWVATFHDPDGNTIQLLQGAS